MGIETVACALLCFFNAPPVAVMQYQYWDRTTVKPQVCVIVQKMWKMGRKASYC